YRTNTNWWRQNQPDDVWYDGADSETTGAGGLIIKRDYRNRLIFEGISRGVVLTGQTGDMNSAGYKAVLDLSHTEALDVLNEVSSEYIYDPDTGMGRYETVINVNRRDEYIDDPLNPGQLIKNPRYIAQVKEQTFKALAGAENTSILMGSDIVLTISDGWLPQASDGITDLLDPINKDYINGYFIESEFYEGDMFDRYFNGQIKGGGKLIKRGTGYLGLSGANELDKSTELQGGGLYIGNVDALGGKYDENAPLIVRGVGLVEVFGDENKVFGIRNDKDYTLTLRFVADANYYPEDPNRTDFSVFGVYEDEATGVIDHNVRPEWLERPAGDLTFDANGRILTIAGVISSNNGGAIEMQAGSAARPWEYGANLYFDSSTQGSGYVFRGNTSDGLGGAIYAGGDLTLVGNTLFDNNTSTKLSGAVHVAGSNLDALTARTQVLFDTTNGGDIVFEINNSYSITFEKNTDFTIQGSGNVYFDAPLKIVGDYDDNGVLIAGQDAAGNGVSLTKDGAGFLQLQGTNEFNGEITIADGTLRLAGVNASLGDSANFTVQASYDDAGKVLSEGGIAGNGTISAQKMTLLGRISPDSAVLRAAQDNLGNLVSANGIAPVVPVKDRVGTLTLNSPEIAFSGVFSVDLGYSTLGQKHTSDKLQINGNMTMTEEVRLTIDYSQMNIADAYKRGVTYTIIESDNSMTGNKIRDSHITHTYNGVERILPRFLMLLSQGFTNDNYEYYLRYGSSGWTFADASKTSNQREIAKAFNSMLEGMDALPAKFSNLLIDIGAHDDNGVSNALENMTTEISANSVSLAQSEAWLSPFKRMVHREPGYRPQVGYLGQSRIPFKVRPRETWIDFYYRDMQTYGDSNARTYNTVRSGFTLGLEKELLDNFSVGAVFGYASPQMTQANGKVESNDFQLGAYALAYLPLNTELRMYIGWSMADYDYTRHERLTLSGLAAISKYTANYNGQNLGFSTELSHPFRWSGWLLLEPIIGIDHQTSRQEAFSETGGLFNQRFNQVDYSRTIARFGLRSVLGNGDDFTLNTRIQYGATLQDSAAVSVSHFEGLESDHAMEMQGIMLGNSYVNLGAGIRIFLNERGTSRISFDYDAYITERSIVNSGNVNFGFQW
ncbi:MAG: autotransporter domain-containing protein, partial [Planctomycetaceae bacterium]|nr:autotransporter domain-containing protein [Planctomycetaceae bacterium]